MAIPSITIGDKVTITIDGNEYNALVVGGDTIDPPTSDPRLIRKIRRKAILLVEDDCDNMAGCMREYHGVSCVCEDEED